MLVCESGEPTGLGYLGPKFHLSNVDGHDHTTWSTSSTCRAQPTMHFAKTYALQLETLPPELRHGVIEYRTLKKLIRQVVDELGTAGLSPDVLQSVRMQSTSDDGVTRAGEIDTKVLGQGQDVVHLLNLNADEQAPVEVIYEFHTRADGTLEPRIRISVAYSSHMDTSAEGLPTPEFAPSPLLARAD